jgi:hypothetical protein
VRSESNLRATEELSPASESEEEPVQSDYDEEETRSDVEEEEEGDARNDAPRAQLVRKCKPVQSIESDTYPFRTQPPHRPFAVVIPVFPETPTPRGMVPIHRNLNFILTQCSGSETTGVKLDIADQLVFTSTVTRR